MARTPYAVAFSLLLAIVPLAAAQPQLPSPLQRAPGAVVEGDFMTALRLDMGAYAAAQAAPAFRLVGLPLSDGRQLDLDLSQFDVLAPDGVLVVADGPDERRVARPDLLLLRGTAAGHGDSAVFLALSPHGSNGYIRLPGETWIIATRPADPEGPALPTVIYNLTALPEGAIQWHLFQCGADALGLEAPGHRQHAMAARIAGRSHPAESTDDPPCRSARIAVETDWQYNANVFFGNSTAAHAYLLTLMGGVSEIFVRDVNTSFQVVYARVWESSNTPYPGMSVDDRLAEFRAHWNANMAHVQRNTAHMLSGLSAGMGGWAYLNQICGGSFAYAVSGYINGSFPYPLVHHHWQNWDPFVVAHEFGHNFGAPHTHDMVPPIDGCGLVPADCTNAYGGTIMSYCHSRCPGGMQNIRLDLHTRIINERILPSLDAAPCSAAMVCGDPGACCLPDYTCESVPEVYCNSVGGTFLGVGSSCANCPPPPSGACCLSGGSCSVLLFTDCAAAGGVFQGAETKCEQVVCPKTFTYTGPGVLIPDGPGPQQCGPRAYAPIVVNEQFIVNHVDVMFHIPHGWQGDVIIGLEHVESNTTVVMLNRPGTSPSNSLGFFASDFGSATTYFRSIDSAPLPYTAAAVPGLGIDNVDGDWKPENPLAAFHGVSSEGTWRLWAQDCYEWDTGSIQRYRLTLGAEPSSCYADCNVDGVLNISDFLCFIDEFAQAQTLPAAEQITHYANCDASTTPPVLTIADFLCFIDEFAQGCP